MTDIAFLGQPEAGSPRPFSAATVAGGLVFVSGHSAPHDPARGIHRGQTPAEEVRKALGRVAATLPAAGPPLPRVLRVTRPTTHPPAAAPCTPESERPFRGGLRARHTARFGVPTEAKVALSCIALAGKAA